ncbi:MAG: hypothetical protein D6805_08810 [Planctomycetota bacterium]|nr:MAG: hypothetical protein D6805_08810 [Planctomycetota bacterium]
MAVLKAEDLSLENWRAKLQQLAPPSGAWMVLTSPSELCFDFFQKERISDDHSWGRVFCPSGEWRWRKLPDGVFRTVFLGEEDWSLLDADHSSHLVGLTTQQKAHILWGERNSLTSSEGESAGKQDLSLAGAWLESILPRPIFYPLETPAKRVKLVLEAWCNQAHEVQFLRYHSLVGYS